MKLRRLLIALFVVLAFVAASGCGSTRQASEIFLETGRLIDEPARLVAVNPDDSSVREITFKDADPDDCCFELSPNGEQVAYTNYGQGPGEIWVMDSDGGNRQRLTFNEDNDNFVRWLPDGRRIAFQRQVGWSNYSMSMKLNGSAPQILFDREGMLGQPIVSPDSNRVAFVAEGPEEGNSEVWVANVDGTSERRIVEYRENGRGSGHPRWSPDGKRIIYQGSLNTGGKYLESKIFIVDADGTNMAQLTNGKGDHNWPVWSPDGERIGYMYTTGFEDIDHQVWVMNADGTEQRFLGQYGRINSWR